jgi:hypothetical protein
VKYIIFNEVDLKDVGKVVEHQKRVREREVTTGVKRKGWKTLFPGHAMNFGKFTGFIICEATEEGLIQYQQDYFPEKKCHIVPIFPLDRMLLKEIEQP